MVAETSEGILIEFLFGFNREDAGSWQLIYRSNLQATEARIYEVSVIDGNYYSPILFLYK